MIIRQSLRWSHARAVSLLLQRCTAQRHTKLHQISRTLTTSTTHIHIPTPPIQPKYQDPSVYNPNLLPTINHVPDVTPSLIQTSTVPTHIKNPDVLVTLYNFPTFEPLQLVHYPATHLHLPLRRDILHKAVIYEGDNTRSDSIGVLTRRDHPGSGRKLVPQKGQGRARAGDSSSPIRSTGVKVHGPKDRSFKTDLPRKIYDLAWRTALSWRYRKGELVVVDRLFPSVGYDASAELSAVQIAKLVEAFNGTSLGSASHPRKDALTKEKPVRTMWVLVSGGGLKEPFNAAMRMWYPKDVVKNVDDVDVKNLLEGKRIVIEKAALDVILSSRQRDIRKPVNIAGNRLDMVADAEAMARAVQEMNELKEEAQRLAQIEAQKLQDNLAKVTLAEDTSDNGERSI